MARHGDNYWLEQISLSLSGGSSSNASVSTVGAAVPTKATLVGMKGSAGNLQQFGSAGGLGQTGVGVDFALGTTPYVYNGTNMDQAKSIVNGTNSTGTGIQAVGVVAQFDDVAPTAITENQVGNVRMSANRNLYGTIRDAAGNERGANVNAANELTVGVGVAAASLGKAEDAAHVSGDTGVMSLTVRSDTAAATAGTTGDYQPQITDSNGSTWMREYYAPAYEDNTAQRALVELRNTYATITTATTTTVKSGVGFLHRLAVTGGTTGTIDIYDNTAGSGTKIASFDTTNALNTYEFNVTFSTGLTIVTSAATKLTVSYR